jgi:hypothetical protein
MPTASSRVHETAKQSVGIPSHRLCGGGHEKNYASGTTISSRQIGLIIGGSQWPAKTFAGVDRQGLTAGGIRYPHRRACAKNRRSREYGASLEEKSTEFSVRQKFEMNQLRDENTRLKRLVADLSLDKVMRSRMFSQKLLKPAGAPLGRRSGITA